MSFTEMRETIIDEKQKSLPEKHFHRKHDLSTEPELVLEKNTSRNWEICLSGKHPEKTLDAHSCVSQHFPQHIEVHWILLSCTCHRHGWFQTGAFVGIHLFSTLACTDSTHLVQFVPHLHSPQMAVANGPGGWCWMCTDQTLTKSRYCFVAFD